MVVVYIAAGLANKMFQYAFSRGLMSHGLDVFLDQTSFQPEWSFEDIALEEVFPNIEIKNAPNNMFSLAYKKDLLSRIYRRMSAFFPNNRYLMERPFIYDELIYKKATSNCIFCGLWQTELYFNFCEKDVRRNFVFTPFQDDQNIQLAEKMKNENSVAIHIRKGADYLKRNIWDGTCSVEYYNQAINYLKEHVSMAKSEQYKAYLTNTQQELILEKTHSCFLPPPDSSHFPDSFLSGVFGDAVKYELSKAGYL